MSELIIYRLEGKEWQGEVTLDEDTVWLIQRQIAQVFGTEVPAINKHIKNIIRENELKAGATISKMEIVQTEDKREVSRNVEIYNLDMIISICYRVNSKRATQFCRWATQGLKEIWC